MSRSGAIAVVAAALFAGLTLFAGVASAQQSTPGAHRTVLDKESLSIPGYDGVLVRTELAPGAREPKHTHPGDIFVYVMEGKVTLIQEGQPDLQRRAGEHFFVPAGRVHGAANEGTKPVKLLVTFIVQQGKPLTTPVPQDKQ
jgi:quercetin dioxygenase-like cupin family protein